MRALMVVLPLWFLGCSEEAPTSPPGENFSQADTVRILSPEHGAVVDPTFTVQYEVGDSVENFYFEVEGEMVTDLTTLDTDAGTLVVTVGEGTQSLRLVGLDGQGEQLSDYAITVNAAGDGPYVTITSPIDGDLVYNPVNFVLDADPDLDSVELLVDGWSIGTVEPGELFTYAFTGVGFERTVEAVGYKDGEIVTRDEITITVDAGTEPISSDFTELMVQILESYPTDGSYGYYWPDDSLGWYGTTQDLYYLGELVSWGDAYNRSYCVGLTWEVFMQAFAIADGMTGGDGSLNGMSVDDLDEFRIDWFIRDLWGDGNVDALYNYGLGEQVTTLEDARAGDVVQFWRNDGSGHNNIFIEWIRDSDDNITGLTYWSTQGSTDGIGYNTEYFGSSGSSINPSYTFLARPYMPTDWIPWQ